MNHEPTTCPEPPLGLLARFKARLPTPLRLNRNPCIPLNCCFLQRHIFHVSQSIAVLLTPCPLYLPQFSMINRLACAKYRLPTAGFVRKMSATAGQPIVCKAAVARGVNDLR